MGERSPSGAGLLLPLLLAGAPALAQGPLPDPVKTGLQAQLVDYVQVPLSAPSGAVARINLLGSAPDDSGRLFVNDMRGQLWTIQNGAVQPQPFLDMVDALGSDFTSTGLQVGLSTFAFHPDFAVAGTDGYGKLYTAHSEVPSSGTPDFESPLAVVTHHDVLAEWSLDPLDPTRIDPSSKRELLRVAQSTRDHNIGQIAFNPNAAAASDDYGRLYVAFGDGGMLAGGEIDPARTAQDRSNPFGSILRIDPLGTSTPDRPTNGQYGIPDANPFLGNSVGALQEIYAYGFRNPHRFSWDTGGDGLLLVSDIGQANIEEIDILLAGGNYGWSEREGPFVVDHTNEDDLQPLPPNDALFGYTYPVAAYDHDVGRAVVGGFVYRGSRAPQLLGKYIFGDVVEGKIFAVDVDALMDGSLAEIVELRLIYEGEERTLLDILGTPRVDLRWGVDEEGEIYVLSKRDGMIRRLVPEPATGWLLAAALAALRFAAPRGRRPQAGRRQVRADV